MKKACKQCKIFVDTNECPICKNADFTTSWKGRIHIIDPEHSTIAKKVGMETKGEYAIKVT